MGLNFRNRKPSGTLDSRGYVTDLLICGKLLTLPSPRYEASKLRKESLISAIWCESGRPSGTTSGVATVVSKQHRQHLWRSVDTGSSCLPTQISQHTRNKTMKAYNNNERDGDSEGLREILLHCMQSGKFVISMTGWFDQYFAIVQRTGRNQHWATSGPIGCINASVLGSPTLHVKERCHRGPT